MQSLYKHAKNFVGDKKPIFEGIHFDGEGVSVTNGSMLLHLSGIPSEVKTVHYQTGTVISGDYPDTSKVIPNEGDAAATVQVTNDQMKEWRKRLKPALLIAGKPYNKVFIKNDLDALIVESRNEASLQTYMCIMPSASSNIQGFEFPISLNVKQLDNILAFLIDKGANNVRICFYKKFAPVLFATETNAVCVLCPLF